MSALRPGPAEIARDVFRELAQQQLPPTPENYGRVYARRAGMPLAEIQPATAAMESMAKAVLADSPPADKARELRDALENGQWQAVQRHVRAILARHPQPQQLPHRPPAPPPAPAALATPRLAPGTAQARDATRALKELLAKTIAFLVDERTGYSAQVLAELTGLVDGLQQAAGATEIDAAAARLRSFWLKLELRGEGPEPVIRGLHDLIRLMVHNMSDLVADDSWVLGQIEQIDKLLDGPINAALLQEAQRSYKEFVFRQGTVKHTFDEAAQAIKDQTATLIERLGTITDSAGAFSESISNYSEQIRSADGLPKVTDVLEKLLSETKHVHGQMSESHRELSASREKVQEYEARVRTLQDELSQMSSLIREDPLTQALNRRGFEQQWVIEQARADRKHTPMCLAVLDIDNFKMLNDRLGHSAGDDALKHLTEVVRDSLRPTDMLARYGGEEFVILLPDTRPDDGEKVMIRVQRELTKRFFLYNNERVLITFSAGLAARRDGESQDDLIQRADRAMYVAKQSGKNRVQRADGD